MDKLITPQLTDLPDVDPMIGEIFSIRLSRVVWMRLCKLVAEPDFKLQDMVAMHRNVMTLCRPIQIMDHCIVNVQVTKLIKRTDDGIQVQV